jgi:hypothetical protein
VVDIYTEIFHETADHIDVALISMIKQLRVTSFDVCTELLN